jgi:hypothetical protein
MSAAAEAIKHLLQIRDEVEMAGRVPGERITITRQVHDAILNDTGVVARLIRELAERCDD